MTEQNNEPSEMTLAEVAEWEQLTGTPIDDLMANGKPRGRSLTATVYILKKRTQPDYTMADASQLTMTQAHALIRGTTNPKAE